MPCARHRERAARALCFICGEPVCEACSAQKDGTFYCQGNDHERTLEEWTRLVTLDSEFEADMLVHNLRTGGIRAQVFSLRAIGDLFPPVTKLAVRIFVERSEESRAVALLQSMADVLNLNSAANTR